jgi:hypothetical protein
VLDEYDWTTGLPCGPGELIDSLHYCVGLKRPWLRCEQTLLYVNDQKRWIHGWKTRSG